ncbi:hypothetical protein [Xanthobacter autotrophicus]|uniref:hypothetical protein n=1 Tax=Xanthobacter autotrophicus TaxID=280 RepID=UPI00372AAE1D
MNFIGLFLGEKGEWVGRCSLHLDLGAGLAVEEAVVGHRGAGIGRAGLRDCAAAATLVIVIVIVIIILRVTTAVVMAVASSALAILLREADRAIGGGDFRAVVVRAETVAQVVGLRRRQDDAEAGGRQEKSRCDQGPCLHGCLPAGVDRE